MNVHAPPGCEQEKAEIRHIVRRQVGQVLDGEKITCAGCQQDFIFLHVFRCFFCGMYFCRRCRKDHFGRASEEKPE